MTAFPVTRELMQAFPLGSLSLLVTVASTVAAQHGVDRAREICRELANNDALWEFVARRIRPRSEGASEESQNVEGAPSVPSPLASEVPFESDAGASEEEDLDSTAVDPALDKPIAFALAIPSETPLPTPAARPRAAKPKRRRKSKANGAVR